MAESEGVHTARRVVLALGGGAARGLAHVGVLRGLEEDGVEVAGIAGTSMGSIVGALRAQGLSASEIEGVFAAIDWPRVGSVLLGPRVGERFHDLLRSILGETLIEELGLPFAAVCCDLDQGAEVVLSRGSLADATRASAALPGLLAPLRVGGRTLVDGAVVTPVPVAAATALADAPVLAVHVLRPSRRGPEPGGKATATPPSRAPSTLFDRVESWLKRQRRGDGPVEVDLPGRWGALARSFEIMQDRLAYCGGEPAAAIEPEVGRFGLFDFERAAEIVTEGHRAYRAWRG